MRAHWPAWIQTHCGAIPSYSTVDYAAKKAVNRLREIHPTAKLIDIGIDGDTDLWLIVPDPNVGGFDCYPVLGGESIRFFALSKGRIRALDKSKCGKRCALAPLRRAIKREFK